MVDFPLIYYNPITAFPYFQMKFIVVLTILFLLSPLYLSQPSGCLLALPGSLQCQLCSLGLQLDDLGNCRLFTPIEGCYIYNSSSNGSQCTNCSQGALLSNGLCLQMIANCLETTNVNTCDRCKEGYTLIRYSNCFSTNVANCPPGTLPRRASEVSFCQQFNVLNCAVLSGDGQSCSNCTQGFTSINGVCFSVQSVLPCPSNGCNCQGYYFSNSCYATQLPNCLQSRDRAYCDLCSDLYYSSSGACTRFIRNSDINCNVLAADGSTCAGCNLNYFLSADFICTKNFQLCQNAPCTACPWNGFTLHSGNCYYQDPLCLVYNFTAQACALCLEGYSLDPLSLACAKETTCLARDPNNLCSKCFTGYQLDYASYQCIQLPNNCALMNTSSLVCLTCAPPTAFNNNICVFPTPNCLSYNVLGYCQTCTANFVQVNRACLPLAPNCDSYNPNDQSKCSLCLPGYRLSNQQCFLAIEGCIVYSPQSACLACNASYLLANGNCFFNDPNCLSQDSNGLCQQCLNGYLPFKSRCVYYDPYCLAYDPATMVCSQSSSAFSSSGGFSLQQQVAYLNFVRQAASLSQNAASADFNGGSGQGSSTRDGKILSLPYAGIGSQSIGSYDLNGNILTCRSGFTLVNSQCVIVSQNCMAYNQMNLCQQCNPGFDLMFDSSCRARSNTSCARQAGGICLQAATGYSLIGGSAYFAGNNIRQMGANRQIVSANSGYFVWAVNNIAWPYDFNCVAQNEPNKCLQCSSSQYSNVRGRCILNKLNCQVYSPYGLCMGCQAGFILWAGECRRANCNGFDPVSGYCNNCATNYVLSLGVCVPRQLPFCQLYNGVGCAFCQGGYYLTSGGMCAKMIAFCQAASAQTGRCSQCVLNYTIYQEQCIPQIANCQVYFANLTSCATCNTLYFPILNSTLCAYLGFYCAALNDSGQCTSCNPGLTLTPTLQSQGNICIRPIPNCFSYDASIKCSRCNSGYVLQYNKCKSLRCGNFNFTASQCMGCLPPFLLTNNSCLDPNCAQNIQETCLACLPRYYLSAGACILSPDPNCLNYSAAGFCVKCLQSYTVNEKGICVSNDIIFYGCSTPAFPCPSCAVGYQLNGSLCYARRCRAFKPNRDCQSCINYYQFESTQRFCILYTCASPSCFTSDSAPAGFYTDGAGSLRISNCVAYNGANCAQCDGYRYPNPSILYNLCFPYNCQEQRNPSCTACNPNFAPTASFPGACLATNCLNWDSTGKCLKCQEKYQLMGNSYCILIQIPFCLVINYASVSCSVCQAGYDLNNGYCRVSNCISWQASNNSLCATCANGYQVDPSSNLCVVGKCEKYASVAKLQCLKCLVGYSFQGPVCRANNCRNWDWSNMKCTSCLDYYELVSDLGVCRASNCNKNDINLACTECSNTTTSVYALRNGVCVSVDINCISFDSNGNCLACNNPSLFINVGDICAAIIQGCVEYSKASCVSCSPAFTLSNGICQVRYCSNFLSPSKCSLCLARYQLQTDFTCVPKNCLSFNNATWACVSCQARFQLVNSQFCFTYNCSGYSVQNYVCNRCQPGFTLSSQACLFLNCPLNNQLACPTCLTGFQLVGGVCQGPRDNCVEYDPNSFICSRCAPRYNVTALGLCVLVQLPDPYCFSYQPSTGICNRCLSNFNYNGQAQQCESIYCSQFNSTQPLRGRACTACLTGFALDPSGKYCISIYCQSYSLASGVCSGCQPGTSINNNVCFALNCASYSTQYLASPICQQCVQGYSLSNSLCRANNCQTFNSDLTCQFCSPGYTLNPNGLCVSTQCSPGFLFQNFNCVPANCLNYTAAACTQCLPGFLQERDSCVADSCIKFNNQYVCTECRGGYNLTIVNGQYLCVLTVQPVCPRGSYLQGGSCIAIPIPSCAIVDASGANCLYCLEGYFLRNNICYSIGGCSSLSYISGCYRCILGFYLQDFTCISLNCQETYPNNTCLSCISGYSLINGACRASIYKCSQSDSQGNCLRCMDNFQLSQGYCIAIGCASYSLSTFVCLSCSTNYYLSGEICLVRITIPNCFQALNASFCSQCENNYVQLTGRCFPQVQFCVSYNPSSGACSICAPNYYLSSSLACLLLPPNCLAANPNGACTNCAPGYIPASGQCVAGTANCRSFDPATALCLTCNEGYYLTANNRCLVLAQFCLSADRSGACTNCRGGYSIANGICVVTISNCVIYNQNNAAYCYQCAQGYYLNTIYTCTLLPPFCTSANNLGACLTCQQGYNLFTNSGLCVIPIPNCVSYALAGQSTRCTQCAGGFTLTGNFTCSSLPRNCLSLDGAGRCGQCVSGYQLYANLCVVGVVNCLAYDSSSYLCSACVSGYYLFLTNGAYICQLLPRFCLSANPQGNCLTCLNNYILYNQLCVLSDSIRNCQSYNLQSYVCLSCFQGYYLNHDYLCTLLPSNCLSASPSGACLSCAQRYQLRGAFCVLFIINCDVFNELTGSCTQCAQGYSLSKDLTTCSLVVYNCQVFNPNGLCLQCFPGYFLMGGYCYLLPQGCSQLNNQQLCIACLPQFTLVQNTCILAIANCALYNINGCYQCLSFYYLLNGACNLFPSNCLSFDTGLLRCVACASGFTLNPSTFICSKTIFISNCAAYNSNGQCINCITRYYLRQNSCWQYPSYCVNVDLLGNCLSCAFGSTLRNGQCVATAQRSLNCLNFNSTTSLCMVCMVGYNFCGVSGICVLPDPGCLIPGVEGNCQQCKSSYQLFQGRCIQYPTGLIVVPNGGTSCASGYNLLNNTCYRSTTQLAKLSSSLSSYLFAYSSNGLTSFPTIGSNTFWSPSQSQLNEYLSIQTANGKPQIVFQIDIRGNAQGWVSGYVLYFKNRGDAPFICWNGCNMVEGNSEGVRTSSLQLTHPVIASELRVYPVRWSGQIALQLQLWTETYQ